jgi:hypothetical protein
LGLRLFFDVRKFLLFKRSKRPFYVDRFLRRLIDYIYSRHLNLKKMSSGYKYALANHASTP